MLNLIKDLNISTVVAGSAFRSFLRPDNSGYATGVYLIQPYEPAKIPIQGNPVEDEGIAEALRRDAEFEANPSLGMTLEELDQRIESRRS